MSLDSQDKLRWKPFINGRLLVGNTWDNSFNMRLVDVLASIRLAILPVSSCVSENANPDTNASDSIFMRRML